MGTRSIICIVKDGAYKLAKYCQWDGYPTGIGEGIAERLRQPGFLDKLKEKCDLLYEMTDEEYRTAWKSIGVDSDENGGWVSFENADKFKAKYPHLWRDASDEVLDLIVRSEKPLGVTNNLDFAADSLFCEWGYVIDFDKETFEIYDGFNDKRPLTESDRFYFLADKERDGYHGIREVAEFTFRSIPSFETLKGLEQGG